MRIILTKLFFAILVNLKHKFCSLLLCMSFQFLPPEDTNNSSKTKQQDSCFWAYSLLPCPMPCFRRALIIKNGRDLTKFQLPYLFMFVREKPLISIYSWWIPKCLALTRSRFTILLNVNDCRTHKNQDHMKCITLQVIIKYLALIKFCIKYFLLKHSVY